MNTDATDTGTDVNTNVTGFLSPSQAADRMEITVTHVRWLCNQGRLRHTRTALGRHIDPADADEWKRTRQSVPRNGQKF